MGFFSMPALLPIHPTRLASAPRLRVIARHGEVIDLAVDGLVCGLCAARTREAMEHVPGVRAARVGVADGTARLEVAGPVDEAALRRALASVVVGARVRRWLERCVKLARAGRRRGRA